MHGKAPLRCSFRRWRLCPPDRFPAKDFGGYVRAVLALHGSFVATTTPFPSTHDDGNGGVCWGAALNLSQRDGRCVLFRWVSDAHSHSAFRTHTHPAARDVLSQQAQINTASATQKKNTTNHSLPCHWLFVTCGPPRVFS